MIRVYARENATQRGNMGTALAGMVASAVRFLAKAIMVGDVELISKLIGVEDTPSVSLISETLGAEDTLSHKIDIIRGQLTSKKGLGEPIISRSELLDKVPGINSKTIGQQLANLKTSGEYARIIGEVEEEIELEHQVALEALHCPITWQSFHSPAPFTLPDT